MVEMVFSDEGGGGVKLNLSEEEEEEEEREKGNGERDKGDRRGLASPRLPAGNWPLRPAQPATGWLSGLFFFFFFFLCSIFADMWALLVLLAWP